MMFLMFILCLTVSWWLPWWWTGVLGLVLGWFGSGWGLKEKRLGTLCFHGVYWPLLPVVYWFDLRTQGAASAQLAAMFHLPWSGLVLLIAPLPMALLCWATARWAWLARQKLGSIHQ